MQKWLRSSTRACEVYCLLHCSLELFYRKTYILPQKKPSAKEKQHMKSTCEGKWGSGPADPHLTKNAEVKVHPIQGTSLSFLLQFSSKGIPALPPLNCAEETYEWARTDTSLEQKYPTLGDSHTQWWVRWAMLWEVQVTELGAICLFHQEGACCKWGKLANQMAEKVTNVVHFAKKLGSLTSLSLEVVTSQFNRELMNG